MKFKICPEYRHQRLKRDVHIADNDRFICLFVNDDRNNVFSEWSEIGSVGHAIVYGAPVKAVDNVNKVYITKPLCVKRSSSICPAE